MYKFLQEIDAEAYSPGKVFSVLQGRLYQQMLPQLPVKTHIYFIPGIFGYHAQVPLKRRLISNATHRPVPLAVFVPLPPSASQMNAETMSF